jgi:hypothetical protein
MTGWGYRRKEAITEFLASEKPKPFVWTATVESIKEKLSRCRQTFEKVQPGCSLASVGKRRNEVVHLFRGHYTSSIPARRLLPWLRVNRPAAGQR